MTTMSFRSGTPGADAGSSAGGARPLLGIGGDNLCWRCGELCGGEDALCACGDQASDCVDAGQRLMDPPREPQFRLQCCRDRPRPIAFHTTAVYNEKHLLNLAGTTEGEGNATNTRGAKASRCDGAGALAVAGSLVAVTGPAGAATTSVSHTIVKNYTVEMGGRTLDVTETILPTIVCVYETGVRVCGTPKYLKYVTTRLTRALEKYYEAYNTVESIGGYVEGCATGIIGVFAVALAPPSEDPLDIGGLKWLAGCGIGAALVFLSGD